MTRKQVGIGSAALVGMVLVCACGAASGPAAQPDASGSTNDAAPSSDATSPTSPTPTETTSPSDAGAPDTTQTTPPADSGAKGSTPDAGGASDATIVDTGMAVVSGDGGAGYGSDGPVPYTNTTFSLTSSSDSFTLNVWIPSTAGKHPVISFSPGLQQLSAGYVPYATRLASWGFVVVMRDDPGILVSGDTVASDIAYTVATWLPAQNTMSGSALYGKADLSHVGLAGHSRGGQATLLAAEGGLKGKMQAWVGLDPVDTAYSAGTAPSTNLPTIGIPTLYIGAGVATNCAPVGDNYQELYAASPSPSIAITVANASHPQFEDLGNCSLCGLICSPMGTANSTTVLDMAIRYLTADFARELLGDATVGALFQGAGAPADEASGAITIVSK